MELEAVKAYLKAYDGPELSIMEVCGSHTAAIAENGIPGLLSPKIRLVSGPGCPVCVTPSAYIDKLAALALEEGVTVVTFGDLLRVPGSIRSLSMAQGEGARVEMVYSPMDVIALAKKEPGRQFVFAAVGFETTTPVYALLVQALIEEGVDNVRLLTALKTMPPVINYLCANGAPVQGFLAPGHVCAVTGSNIFAGLAESYRIPFGVSGFAAEEILTALYGIVKMCESGRAAVMNFYPSVVTEEGNLKARALVEQYFTETDAAWRGMGKIERSGLVLREEFARYDAGSLGLDEDQKKNQACCCDRVLMGRMRAQECPLFKKVCNPMNPQGACMVSTEGACFSYYMRGA